MVRYIAYRLVLTLVTLFLLSFAIFAIVQIPPGNAVDREVLERQARGDIVTPEELKTLRAQYGLDRPLLVRYCQWVEGFCTGDLGRSTSGRQVSYLVMERLPQTVALSFASLLVTYAVAIPLGIYSATHQYSRGDYLVTSLGFVGISMPGFLVGIILVYVFHRWLGVSIGGFFSPEYRGAPWSLGRVWDLISHLWVPLLAITISGTGGLMRTVRAQLLDELGKQYVMTARAKGVPWGKLVLKYPLRVALIPVVAGIAHIFPALLSGQVVVSIVLNLPTLGPLLNTALITEDVALSSSVLLIQSLLAVVGTVISDVLLAIVDPRIRFERAAH